MDNKIVVGAKVSFLDDVGEGLVKELLNNNQAVVLRDDGFEEVYALRQLIAVSKETHSEASFKYIPEGEEVKVEKKKLSKRHKKNSGLVWEVDLHIEELILSHRNMTNFEIVQYQLRHCEGTLNRAHKQKVHKLIIIHGRGEGVLKEEVLRLLKKYPVAVQDADYRTYGFGATEVRFY